MIAWEMEENVEGLEQLSVLFIYFDKNNWVFYFL